MKEKRSEEAARAFEEQALDSASKVCVYVCFNITSSVFNLRTGLQR